VQTGGNGSGRAWQIPDVRYCPLAATSSTGIVDLLFLRNMKSCTSSTRILDLQFLSNVSSCERLELHVLNPSIGEGVLLPATAEVKDVFRALLLPALRAGAYTRPPVSSTKALFVRQGVLRGCLKSVTGGDGGGVQAFRGCVECQKRLRLS